MSRKRRICITAFAFAATVFIQLGDVRAFQLVTEQEAALPDDPSGNVRAGISRGPKFSFLPPVNADSPFNSPVPLQIKFQTFGGASIDQNSIVVIYKKLPPVDVTTRLRSFVRADGLDIESVELPSGLHRFQISISDDGGRRNTQFFTIDIEPPTK